MSKVEGTNPGIGSLSGFWSLVIVASRTSQNRNRALLVALIVQISQPSRFVGAEFGLYYQDKLWLGASTCASRSKWSRKIRGV
jgi:hypothetical protein